MQGIDEYLASVESKHESLIVWQTVNHLVQRHWKCAGQIPPRLKSTQHAYFAEHRQEGPLQKSLENHARHSKW